jgi:hypothetical protein
MAESNPVAAPSGRRRLEAAIPAAVLILRVATRRTPWYFDWMIVLSLLWILIVLFPGKKARTVLAVGAMLLLFGIYLVRGLPQLVNTYQFCLWG